MKKLEEFLKGKIEKRNGNTHIIMRVTEIEEFLSLIVNDGAFVVNCKVWGRLAEFNVVNVIQSLNDYQELNCNLLKIQELEEMKKLYEKLIVQYDEAIQVFENILASQENDI